MKISKLLPVLIMLVIQACNQPVNTKIGNAASTELNSVSPQPVRTVFFSPSPTETVIPSLTPTLSDTPTITITPTITVSPGPSITPTFVFPVVVVNKQAHCRYGPNIAYLHAADLYPGDTGSVRGRYALSKWLLVKFEKINYFCWVAPSVVDVTGDVNTIYNAEIRLPGPSVLYKAPQDVTAVRHGSKVTISWSKVKMTSDDDRGYLLDIFVCQGKGYFWYPVALDDQNQTDYTIKDEKGCPAPSGGFLYTVEKHGYSKPVPIKWPEP